MPIRICTAEVVPSQGQASSPPLRIDPPGCVALHRLGGQMEVALSSYAGPPEHHLLAEDYWLIGPALSTDLRVTPREVSPARWEARLPAQKRQHRSRDCSILSDRAVGRHDVRAVGQNPSFPDPLLYVHVHPSPE
eukprot:gene15719-biopygen23217